jgi:hypothetical protein
MTRSDLRALAAHYGLPRFATFFIGEDRLVDMTWSLILRDYTLGKRRLREVPEHLTRAMSYDKRFMNHMLRDARHLNATGIGTPNPKR